MKNFAAFLLCLSLSTALLKANDHDENTVLLQEMQVTETNEGVIEKSSNDAFNEKLEKLNLRIENGSHKALYKLTKLVASKIDLQNAARECAENIPFACTEFFMKTVIKERYLDKLPKYSNNDTTAVLE